MTISIFGVGIKVEPPKREQFDLGPGPSVHYSEAVAHFYHATAPCYSVQ